MMVLGFRAEPSSPRYAVVERQSSVTLLNAASDSKLPIPASIADDADSPRLAWLYQEIAQIFERYPSIKRVVIKGNEFTQSDTKAKRKSAYLDAAVMLCCAHRAIPVDVKTYASLGTTSARTKQDAEARVGRTNKYWDTKIADAINAALWGLDQQ